MYCRARTAGAVDDAAVVLCGALTWAGWFLVYRTRRPRLHDLGATLLVVGLVGLGWFAHALMAPSWGRP
jgi:hypothetical protein